MAQDFSRVVEDVKQLSTEEKEELQELRREIETNYEASLEGLREGALTFSSDPETLRKVLANDLS